jgi:hypothetical protein
MKMKHILCIFSTYILPCILLVLPRVESANRAIFKKFRTVLPNTDFSWEIAVVFLLRLNSLGLIVLA